MAVRGAGPDLLRSALGGAVVGPVGIAASRKEGVEGVSVTMRWGWLIVSSVPVGAVPYGLRPTVGGELSGLLEAMVRKRCGG